MENNLQKKPKLNLFALVSVASGFYVGYQEGKGVEMSETKEYLMKYGPTVFATVFSPGMLKIVNYTTKASLKNLTRGLENGSLNVTLGSKITKKYMDLTIQERLDVSPKLRCMKETLEKKLARPNYLESAFTSGATTAVQTSWGYLAGRFCSQIV